MNAKTELDVLVPNLPRKRKLPGFYHSKSSNDSFHNDHPKKIIVSCNSKPLNEFDVPSLKNQLLNFTEIAKFYGLDSRMQLYEMIALLQKLDTIKRMLLAEVIKLVKLILVMPATSAVSDRSLSPLKRIKAYLRSATTNNRLNHPLILHIHKLLSHRIDLTKVADEFVERREGRKSNFGLS